MEVHDHGLLTASDVEKGQPNNDDVRNSSENQRDQAPEVKVVLSRRRFWVVILGLNLGMLLTALDFNIVATAVPIISSEFNEYQKSAWIGTGFFVAFALVLPVFSKLGSVFGNGHVFNFATATFILGSGLCGGSKSMDMLIASRIVQGIGAGGIYGLVNVIITDLVPLKDVGKYLSITGSAWVLADVVGPLLGGAFSQYVSWRWCFYVNLCVSPISLLITTLALKLPRRGTYRKPMLRNLDYTGTLLLVGGAVCILLGISWGGNTFPWRDSRVIGCLVGGALLLCVFPFAEHYVKDPLVHPTLLRNPTILIIAAAEFFFGANMIGSMYYIPQFFQLVFGDSATLSGVGLLPMMLGIVIGSSIAALLTSRREVSLINAQIGAAIAALASGLMTRWNAHTSRAETVVLLIIIGMGQGAVMSGLLLSAQAATPRDLISITTGFAIFVQAVGDNFGVALFSAVYINELRSSLTDLSLPLDEIARILQDIQSIKSSFSGAMHDHIVDAYADSMRNGWWLMFACAAAMFVLSLLAKQPGFTKDDGLSSR